MFPFSTGMQAKGVSTRFIKSFAAGGTGGTLASFGIIAGDLMCYASMNAGPPGTLATGATNLGSDGAMQHFYKVVDATDAASSFTFVALTLVMFYRGPKRTKRSGSYSGTTGAWAGFTKDPSHLALAGFMYSNSGGGGSYNPDTGSASFTSRSSTFSSPYEMYSWDRLGLTTAPYSSGQTFNYNFSPSAMITAIELLSL